MGFWHNLIKPFTSSPATEEQETVFRNTIQVYDSLRSKYIDAMGVGGLAGIIPGVGSIQQLAAKGRISDFDVERRDIVQAFADAETEQDVIKSMDDAQALVDAARASFTINRDNEVDPDLSGQVFRSGEYTVDSEGTPHDVEGAPDLRKQLADDADARRPVESFFGWSAFTLGLIGVGAYFAMRAGYLPTPKMLKLK